VQQNHIKQDKDHLKSLSSISKLRCNHCHCYKL